MDEAKEYLMNDRKALSFFDGKDFANLTLDERIQFAIATGVTETGMLAGELIAFDKALCLAVEGMTYLELGQCTGTSTRFALTHILKHGGELNSVEINIRPDFKVGMEALGLWDKINTINENTQTLHWTKQIDFLLIDTEHAIADALGEYCRFRGFLSADAIIGFHDAWEIPGVRRSIEIIQEIDELEEVARSPRGIGFGLRFFKIKSRNKTCNHIRPESIEEMI